MPTAQGLGPFSYETLDYNVGNNYALNAGSASAPKTLFDSDNGETLEVYADGTLLEGTGTSDSLSAANTAGDGFYVDSLTSPTKIHLVSNVGSGEEVLIKRISNRATPQVDFAPGSVIREQDLDAATNQTLHVAQEAVDIALQGITFHAGDYWDAQQDATDKKIRGVLAGTADNDATNVGQFNTHDQQIEDWKDDTEDYKLEAADWATKVNGVVNTYTDTAAQSDGTDQSAKAYAIGGTGVTQTASKGAAKEWAVGTGRIDDQTTGGYSAKEHATGTTVAEGSSKEWATNAGSAEVATSAGYSSKAYAQDTGNDIGSSRDWATLGTQVASTDYSSKQYAVGTPPDGSAKEWAKTTGAVVADSEYSAKEYSQGVTATGGTAKQWALGGGSFVEATEVTTGLYSARKYASDASASEVAAANSAAAVSQVYDNFSDVYLGSMADGATADTGTLTGASWSKDSSSIAFTGTTGTISVGQELTSTGSGYPVGANIIGSSVSTPLVISNPFTVAGTGATLDFVGSGIYGAYDSGIDGPSTNNDGDALVVGNLFFNSTDNEMRIYDGANWIAATSAGDTSLLEYKFVTTSGQVSSKTYSGTADVGGTLSYTQNNIIVFMNGVQLKDTTDYTATNGTSVVLVAAPVENDEIAIIAFKSFTTADMVSRSNGGTFASAVTFSAGLVANTVDINGGTIDGCTITGNISGNAGGTAATVTGAAQTQITSVGTLTGLTVKDSTVAHALYDSTPVIIAEGTEARIQVMAADSGGQAGAIILSSSPTGDGDNKHWVFHHNGVNNSDRLDIGYGTTSSNLENVVTAGATSPSLSFDTSGNVSTSTTGKFKQKGAFMQSSTHQALTLGY
jgi:hypothetical protein